LGSLFVLLAIAGIVLPLLPTTPFLLLAGYCFSKGSPQFHSWIINHRILGPPIKDWEEKGAIRLNYKLMATAMMAISAFYIGPRPEIPLIGKVSFSIFAGMGLIYLRTRPTH
jgi:uncharacterized membrane protein YbaN (DUF454 family)